MLIGVLSGAGLFEVALAIGVMVFAGTVIATFVRRVRRLRGRLQRARAEMSARLLAASLRPRFTLDARARATHRIRVELAGAVAQADAALRSAKAAGASLGELPLLLTRLKTGATHAERALRISEQMSRAPHDEAVLTQAHGLIDVAVGLQRAARQAIVDLSMLASAGLNEELSRETTALISGQVVARSADEASPRRSR
jgi:hypothetical protein